MNCIYCNSSFTNKKGKRNNVQQYQCKTCHKYYRESYSIKRINKDDERYLVELLIWGNSIRGMAYFSKFSHVSVLRALVRIAERIKEPALLNGQIFEVDEIQTFIALKKRRRRSRSGTKGKKKKKNEHWITYAIHKSSGGVACFTTGKRNKKTIGEVTHLLVESNAKTIYTDGLNLYKGLIPQKMHRTYERCTNKIERNNLTLRNRLKRLCRKTLSFNRSSKMLEACLRIFFWWQYCLNL